MRITADLGKCRAYGNCLAAAPDIYDLTEDDVVMILEPNPAPDREEAARSGVRQCPSKALAVEEGDA